MELWHNPRCSKSRAAKALLDERGTDYVERRYLDDAPTAEQLDALPGVGPVTAAAIVAWRDAHGRFGSVDQLGDVDGIGPARLDKLRPLVSAG